MAGNIHTKHDMMERLFILTTMNSITNKRRVNDEL
jgi:hypothetical protein